MLFPHLPCFPHTTLTIYSACTSLYNQIVKVMFSARRPSCTALTSYFFYMRLRNRVGKIHLLPIRAPDAGIKKETARTYLQQLLFLAMHFQKFCSMHQNFKCLLLPFIFGNLAIINQIF